MGPQVLHGPLGWARFVVQESSTLLPLPLDFSSFPLQEETHCKSVALDFATCDKFQLYLHSFAFQKQRVGYLYGAFGENGEVTVDFIHEPPQDGYAEHFEFLESREDAERVELLAAHLGYQKVACFFPT